MAEQKHNGIYVPANYNKPQQQAPLTEAQLRAPAWDRFVGFDHRQEFRRYTRGENRLYLNGPISFAKHLGKELSQDLWDDLVGRMRPSTLEIYKGPSEIKTIGRFDCVIIFMDNVGLDNPRWIVRDIQWNITQLS